MILISHRGNIDGRFESYENEPTYIDIALSKGYDVEIDIWYVDNKIYLGHDNPQYSIDFRWIRDRSSRLWIHCKNIDSLSFLKESGYPINFFWHQEDDITITSTGIFWTYPGKQLTKYSIAVMPEYKKFNNISMAYGICSDYIENYRELNNEN